MSNGTFDDFTYEYDPGTNRLNHVVDEANHMVNNLGDIGYHSQTIDNYGYDAIGQLVSDDDEDISSIEWTVTGKVKQITKAALGITIRFEYDGLGNRIAKHVTEGGDVTSTYYVLDAQGNVMHVYTGNIRAVDGGGTAYYLYLSERNLYGSSRLGQEQVNMVLTQAAPFNYSGMLDNAYGDKRYELSNHLGNVLQVITDRKLPENDGTSHVAHYLADVVSYSDYFPYGMQMPGRHGGEIGRYGFQNQEIDNEIKGTGNSVNYKYRMHDPRIGRFFAVDPLAGLYPWNSPYAFSENVVIHMIELEGLETSQPKIYVDERGNTHITQAVDNLAVQKQIDQQIQSINITLDFRTDSEKFLDQMEALKNNPNKVNTGTIGPVKDATYYRIEGAKMNLNNYGQYIIPGGGILNKMVQGQEVGWSDIGVEAAGLLPITKIFGAVGKVVLKSEFAEGAVKEVANFMKQNAKETIDVVKSRLSKSIKSHTNEIAKHKEYIANPKQKYGDAWDTFSTERKNNVIHHWEQDIKRHEAYKSAKEAALKEM